MYVPLEETLRIQCMNCALTFAFTYPRETCRRVWVITLHMVIWRWCDIISYQSCLCKVISNLSNLQEMDQFASICVHKSLFTWSKWHQRRIENLMFNHKFYLLEKNVSIYKLHISAIKCGLHCKCTTVNTFTVFIYTEKHGKQQMWLF